MTSWGVPSRVLAVWLKFGSLSLELPAPFFFLPEKQNIFSWNHLSVLNRTKTRIMWNRTPEIPLSLSSPFVFRFLPALSSLVVACLRPAFFLFRPPDTEVDSSSVSVWLRRPPCSLNSDSNLARSESNLRMCLSTISYVWMAMLTLSSPCSLAFLNIFWIFSISDDLWELVKSLAFLRYSSDAVSMSCKRFLFLLSKSCIRLKFRLSSPGRGSRESKYCSK